MIRTLVLLISVMVVCIVATPAGDTPDLSLRAPTDKLFVAVDNTDKFCMILPREISQSPSGAPVVQGDKTFCTAGFGTSKKHGTAPSNLWNFKVFKRGKRNGHRFAQIIGCINKGLPPPFSDLNVELPTVAPLVRFDSDGGGHPRGSLCIGYKHYVEILNPNNNGQACLTCCDDPNGCSGDCPTVCS